MYVADGEKVIPPVVDRNVRPALGVGVAVMDGVTDGEFDPVPVAVGVTVCEGDHDALAPGESVAVAEGVTLGVGVAVAVALGQSTRMSVGPLDATTQAVLPAPVPFAPSMALATLRGDDASGPTVALSTPEGVTRNSELLPESAIKNDPPAVDASKETAFGAERTNAVVVNVETAPVDAATTRTRDASVSAT
jgi:hypothetical protein